MRVTLVVPHDSYYVVLEDYIPAGAEILNPSLKTTQLGFPGMELAPQPLFDPNRPFAEGWGWWYFHPAQMYADRIAWASDFLPAGTYQLTYVLAVEQPGEYRVLPARSWQMYFPDVMGNSAGQIFEIHE